MSEFKSHWVPHSYDLVPHLSKMFSKLLPALETITTSNMVRVNLNAVRKSFMEAETSEKVLRALRSNVRIYAAERFVTDDSV